MRPASSREEPDVALRRLLSDIVGSRGALDPEVRRRAAAGEGLPEPLAAYAAKVAGSPAELGLADVEALRDAGFTEDQVFELTVSAAVGGAKRRLEAGLRAMQEVEEW